jgi:hypothetical protein
LTELLLSWNVAGRVGERQEAQSSTSSSGAAGATRLDPCTATGGATARGRGARASAIAWTTSSCRPACKAVECDDVHDWRTERLSNHSAIWARIATDG